MIEVRVRISGDIDQFDLHCAFVEISKNYGGGSLIEQLGCWDDKLEKGYALHFTSRDIYSDKDRKIIENALMPLDVEHIDVKIFACESESFKIFRS